MQQQRAAAEGGAAVAPREAPPALVAALLALAAKVRSKELAWLHLGWSCLAFCLVGATLQVANQVH